MPTGTVPFRVTVFAHTVGFWGCSAARDTLKDSIGICFAQYSATSRLQIVSVELFWPDIVRYPHVRVTEISERNRGDSIVIDDMLLPYLTQAVETMRNLL